MGAAPGGLELIIQLLYQKISNVSIISMQRIRSVGRLCLISAEGDYQNFILALARNAGHRKIYSTKQSNQYFSAH